MPRPRLCWNAEEAGKEDGDVEVIYEGKDITGYVQVKSCSVREAGGGRCDSLEIEFENAAAWYGWGPEEDDRILVAAGDYDTGTLYVHSVLPGDGRYRIMATALPCRARRREWRSFIGKSIGEIIQTCAMSAGMDYQVFGIDENTVIPYIEQAGEGAAAFLDRFLRLEGAALKCVNGKLTAIGILYAQEREAHQTIEVTARQSGADYRRSGATIRALTVRTPYAAATARDEAVPSTHISVVENGYPALDDVQAGRWARGLLLHANRACESFTIRTEFNGGLAAMTRIDITGNTDAAGAWLVDEAEHDLINGATTARLARCVTTIV